MNFRAMWNLLRRQASTPGLPTENTRCGRRAHLLTPRSIPVCRAGHGHHPHPTEGQGQSGVISLAHTPQAWTQGSGWGYSLSLCLSSMPSTPPSQLIHKLSNLDSILMSPFFSPLPTSFFPEESQLHPLLKQSHSHHTPISKPTFFHPPHPLLLNHT